jgi:hypothetical protein
MTLNPVQAARAEAAAERAQANATALEAFQAAQRTTPAAVYPAALARALGVSKCYIGHWLHRRQHMHPARLAQVYDFLSSAQ